MLLARCPSCGNDRDVDVQTSLRQVEATWVDWETTRMHGMVRPRGSELRHLAWKGEGNWFWACDDCIASGRAVAADVTWVNISMGTPFAAYVDRPFVCEDCHAPWIFSAREQKHWFETLGFLIWVYPKQCAPCRAKRRAKARANTALAEALHNLDASDPTQLEAVARLYDELGSTRKAAEFRGRAKNRR